MKPPKCASKTVACQHLEMQNRKQCKVKKEKCTDSPDQAAADNNKKGPMPGHTSLAAKGANDAGIKVKGPLPKVRCATSVLADAATGSLPKKQK